MSSCAPAQSTIASTSVIGHDPDAWDDFPESVDDLPPALPVNLPNPERRRDFNTRNRVERSWREVRNEMGDALDELRAADLGRFG